MFDRDHYITGTTALNIGINGKMPALWHSTYIANRRGWCVSGVNFKSTVPLIGYAGIHDATDELKKRIPDLESQTFIASHERALFDFLHEFLVVRNKPVPNIQSTDIDDVVDYSKVMKWIDQAESESDATGWDEMRNWLLSSDYSF